MKLELNYKKKTGKNKNGGLKDMLLNNQLVNEEIKRQTKHTWRKTKTETQ